MKFLAVIIGIFVTTMLTMECLHLLNKGSTIMNIVGLIGIFLLIYTTIKTKVFTSFKIKK